MPPEKSKIFLSYAREDKPKVEVVYQELIKAGFQPWMDVQDLLPGQIWDKETKKAISDADFILLFFSDLSVSKRGYVQKEFKLALDVLDEIPEGDIFIIPVRLDDCQVPERFRHIHYCDLFGLEGFDQVIKAIKKESGPQVNVLPKRSEEKAARPPVVEKKRNLINKKFALAAIILVVLVSVGTYFVDNTSTSPDKTSVREVNIEFVTVPGGTFLMGDVWGDGDEDEQPVHSVTVSGFEMSKHEITVGQFRVFVNDTGYKTTAEKQGWAWIGGGKEWEQKDGASWRSPEFSQEDTHPVVSVSWDDAIAFCDWLSKKEGKTVRLPTEAEWEFAARWGGEKLKYPNGNVLTHEDANISGTGGKDKWDRTSPVGSFDPSGLGLYDMAGNVWEWCQDWHADKYQLASQANPIGAAAGEFRVIRSGSWLFNPNFCRTVNRFGARPSNTNDDYGFRVLRNGKEL